MAGRPVNDSFGLLAGAVVQKTACARSLTRAINDTCSVVGFLSVIGNDRYTLATIWEGTTAIDLNTLLGSSGAGWTLIDAMGINSRGQIVGYGYNPVGQVTGFLLTGSS